MTEENKGEAVALPEKSYLGDDVSYGYDAEDMLTFRAEGEATLRARLAAAEAEVVRLRAQRDEAVALEHKHDTVSKALRRAFQLGQTYFQQGDSEYTSQWKKADQTLITFNELIDTTLASLKEQAA